MPSSESKCESPVRANSDSPGTLAISFQRVQPKGGLVHILNLFRSVERREDQTQPVELISLGFLPSSCSNSSCKPLCRKLRITAVTVKRHLTFVNSDRGLLGHVASRPSSLTARVIFPTSLAPNLLTVCVPFLLHSPTQWRCPPLGVLHRGLVRWAGLSLSWLGCTGLARFNPRTCPLPVAEPAARRPALSLLPCVWALPRL